MKRIRQSFQVSFAYDIQFTEGVFDLRNDCLKNLLVNQAGRKTKVLCVIDEGLALAHPHLENDIQDYFRQHRSIISLASAPIVVPGGEEVKNDYVYVEQLLKAIHTHSIDKHAYLIAIGGGAVLDMAGFAASIAHRGIRHIRIPTTVLSQNDSGVGVKNGVNMFGKKNFTGNFSPPEAVINDILFLQTLEDRDWRAGIAEAIKVALIKDRAFFEFLEMYAEDFNQRKLAPMNEMIYRCAALHTAHIAGGDPFEKGSSRPLDFGHWAAHKLEQLTHYSLRHGEAVAIGIALDVCYATLIGLLPHADKDRILNLFKKLGFELYVPALSLKDQEGYFVLKGLEEFREHLGGELTIMLLESIGKGIEVHEMQADKILEAISELSTAQEYPIFN